MQSFLAILTLCLGCTLCACASRQATAPNTQPQYQLTLTNGALHAAMSSDNQRDEKFVMTVFSVRSADGEEDYRSTTSTSRAQGHGDGPLAYSTGEDFHASGDIVTARFETFDRAGRLRTNVTRTIQAP